MAEITMIKTPAETGLSQAFEAAKASLPGSVAEREKAFQLFSGRGLPHRRVEEFKYTDLRAAMRDAAPLAGVPSSSEVAEAAEAGKAFAGIDAARITIANGHVAAVDQSDAFARLGAMRVEAKPLAEALASGHPLLSGITPVPAARDNPIYQLNSAFMFDGLVIRVPAGVSVETPIHLRFLTIGSSAIATATRVLVVVEEGASLTLLESHEGQDAASHQPNDAVEFVVGDKATVRHVRLNAEGPNTLALSTLAAKLGAGVSFSSLNVVVGGQVSRHQVYIAFAGEHSSAQINGATMVKGRQHADSTLLVDHSVPHCDSRELFKTVVDDEATGVFQGKIIVHPQAQKTDGRMMSGCLLLSEAGTMNNKPELEIFADDVQCAHGATCGALDDELLFYLMARGLPRKEAESLLVQAFLGEAVESVEHDDVREALMDVVSGWLAARA